jgi:hypothetical protein
MNVATAMRKVQRLFGDDNNVILNDQDIWDWIDEAQMQIIRKTHCLTKTATGAASTYPLNLPADYIMAKRITYGPNNDVLLPILIDDLDDADINPAGTNDSPAYYYIANKQVNLFPNKGSTDTTNNVSFTYVCAAAAITGTGIALDTPLSFHEDIVRYCVMRAHERNENYRAQDMSNTIFEGMSGERMHEATLNEDGFYVIRDDPGDSDYYWMDAG